MTSPQPNPRRRLLSKDIPPSTSCNTTSTHDAAPNPLSTNLPLRKSSTFHSPTTPPSQDDDPIVNIPLLPRRSPTCPKDLAAVADTGDDRLRQLIGGVDRSLSGLETFSTDSQDTLRAEDFPLPRGVLDVHAGGPDNMVVDYSSDAPSPPPFKQRPGRKHHSSDSGIGSTVTGSEVSLPRTPAGRTCNHDAHDIPTSPNIDVGSKQNAHNALSGLSSVSEIKSGINGSAVLSAGVASGTRHMLSEYACRHIQKHVIAPIVSESSLKAFHPLVLGIPYRVGRKEITCLRDLEKVLLWLAPVSGSSCHWERRLAHFLVFGVKKWSVNRKSFVNFCETTIQCLHTTVEFLSESDQRRPTDRPYTNGYFLDLTEQVRQYAAMITATRARIRAGRRPTDDDCTM